MNILAKYLLGAAMLIGLSLPLTACAGPLGPQSHHTLAAAGGIVTSVGNSSLERLPEEPVREQEPSSDNEGDTVPQMPELPKEEQEDMTAEAIYVFGTPLAEGEQVEDSFFDGAVFLGDSRTEGLQLYSGLKRGKYLWYRGAFIYIADDPRYAVFDTGNGKGTMLEALAQEQYGAVYIMAGINELGNTPKRFETALKKFVDKVISLQPEAVIYLQTIPPVNDALVRSSGKREFVTNGGIDSFNEVVIRVAKEKRVLLLDVAEVYRGEDGQLPAELTTDGCHFKAKYYARWADYLRSHVMDAETYHRQRTAQAEAAAGEQGAA